MNRREAMFGRRIFWANCCLWGGIVISIFGWVVALWVLHGGYRGYCGGFLECALFLLWLVPTQFVAFVMLALAAGSFERGVIGRWLAGWMAVAVLLIPVLVGLSWFWFAVTQ